LLINTQLLSLHKLLPSTKSYNIETQLDGCIVWNADNTVLGKEALLIHIVPVGYAT